MPSAYGLGVPYRRRPVSCRCERYLVGARFSAQIVRCPETLPRSREGSRGGWRGWDSTMLTGRVCAVVVTAVAVCLSLVPWIPS